MSSVRSRREALDAAERATTLRLLEEARADIEKRMARTREAVAEFGDCAPYLRERAEACLDRVEPLAADPGVREAGAMLHAVFTQARSDAKSVAGRRRREALRERLEGLPDVHDSEDTLWELSEQRSKAGLALFRQRPVKCRLTARKRGRPRGGWRAASGGGEGNARVSDVHRLVPGALSALPVWSVTNLSARGHAASG